MLSTAEPGTPARGERMSQGEPTPQGQQPIKPHGVHLNPAVRLSKRWGPPLSGVKLPAKVQWVRLDVSDWHEEAQFLLSAAADSPPSIVVIDVSVPVHEKNAFTDYLQRVRSICTVCYFDNITGKSIDWTPQLELNLVVCPFVTESEVGRVVSGRTILLLGPSYFVFAREYLERSLERGYKAQGTHVLITFGGSDPMGLSVRALTAIRKITDRVLAIRVVIGPQFASRQIIEIRELARGLNHDCEIVMSPDSLIQHMLWCDVAISATGLTKYELAVTGTPAILMSIDVEHAQVNEAFAKRGTARDLGVWEIVSVHRLAEEISELLDSPDARVGMGRHGRVLTDGKGVHRVVEEICGIVDGVDY